MVDRRSAENDEVSAAASAVRESERLDVHEPTFWRDDDRDHQTYRSMEIGTIATLAFVGEPGVRAQQSLVEFATTLSAERRKRQIDFADALPPDIRTHRSLDTKSRLSTRVIAEPTFWTDFGEERSTPRAPPFRALVGDLPWPMQAVEINPALAPPGIEERATAPTGLLLPAGGESGTVRP